MAQLGLLESETASPDSSGNLVFDFDAPPIGIAWTGTVGIVDLLSAVAFTVEVDNRVIGQFIGPGPYGPIQAFPGQYVRVVGTQVPAGSYMCQWTGQKTPSGSTQRVSPAALSAALTRPISVSFAATGADQAFTVPGNVTAITIDFAGGQGGTNTGVGGKGSRLQGTLPVVPGASYVLKVGKAGPSNSGGFYTYGAGRGGPSNTAGAPGGGGSTGLVDSNGSIIAAAAGGGGGELGGTAGGAGDGPGSGTQGTADGGIGASGYPGGGGGWEHGGAGSTAGGALPAYGGTSGGFNMTEEAVITTGFQSGDGYAKISYQT